MPAWPLSNYLDARPERLGVNRDTKLKLHFFPQFHGTRRLKKHSRLADVDALGIQYRVMLFPDDRGLKRGPPGGDGAAKSGDLFADTLPNGGGMVIRT